MLTIAVSEHQATLTEAVYIRLAAALASDHPDTAAAMLQKITDAGCYTAEELWQLFTHEIETVGDRERFDAMWKDGRVLPYLVFLVRHARAVVVDALTGARFDLGNSVQLLSRAAEAHLMCALPASARSLRILFGSDRRRTWVDGELGVERYAIVDSVQLEEDYGTGDVVIVLGQ